MRFRAFSGNPCPSPSLRGHPQGAALRDTQAFCPVQPGKARLNQQLSVLHSTYPTSAQNIGSQEISWMHTVDVNPGASLVFKSLPCRLPFGLDLTLPALPQKLKNVRILLRVIHGVQDR